MEQDDPFEGLGRALARLRKRAGFPTQSEASEALKIDRGQLSRWEHDSPRPTLENLGRLLAGYGATLGDLVVALGEPEPQPIELGPSDAELIRSLVEAIHRVEGRQATTESRLDQLARELDRPPTSPQPADPSPP